MTYLKQKVLNAETRIRSYIRETPLDYSLALSKITNSNVYLKCENLQYTGSFKVRGALNALLSLSSTEQQRGVVTASTGNHGAAVAYGLHTLSKPGVIFVPEDASSTKVANIRQYDIPVEFQATDCMQTEQYARDYAKQHHMLYIPPYNDLNIIAGQGTVALEIARQLDKINIILAPVGGGGLISGIAGYMKSLSPNTQIIGCLPENSPVMADSIKAGKIVEMECLPTLSDATAGGIEPNAITFDICKQYVDDFILVSESAIKHAISTLIHTQHLLAEGAAGVSLGSLLENPTRFHNKNVVVILSGANISLDSLKTVLN